MTKDPDARTSGAEMDFRTMSTFGLTGAATAVAGLLCLDLLTASPLVAPLSQSAFVIAGLWTGSRIAFRQGRPGGARWAGALVVLFLGPLSLDLLWDRQMYWELPRWALVLATATATSASAVLSLRLLARRFSRLPAVALALASSGFYVLGVFESPRFLSFWILALIPLGGWWISTAVQPGSQPGGASRDENLTELS